MKTTGKQRVTAMFGKTLSIIASLCWPYRAALFLALFVAALMIGCATPNSPSAYRLPTRQSPFNEEEFLPYARTGNCTITGQAFLKTRGGNVIFGAGNNVELVPMTSYNREEYERMIVGGTAIEMPDPRALIYNRVATADGTGCFEFHGVPAGEYYLYCTITWEVPGEYGMRRTGGVAYGKVFVSLGQTAKVILTH